MPTLKVSPIFPTPVMHVRGLFKTDQIDSLRSYLIASATSANAKSRDLKHTEISGDTDERLNEVATALNPTIARFGEHLFGERLTWSVKEIWGNVLENGGSQSVHLHANSFVSGILYLTEPHPSARTVFHRSLGGGEFAFKNDNARAKQGPYNAGKWVAPETAAGDVVLYPSSLLHEVPVNEGEQRVTIAFNAMPHQLDSWGYTLKFS